MLRGQISRSISALRFARISGGTKVCPSYSWIWHFSPLLFLCEKGNILAKDTLSEKDNFYSELIIDFYLSELLKIVHVLRETKYSSQGHSFRKRQFLFWIIVNFYLSELLKTIYELRETHKPGKNLKMYSWF